MKKTLRISIAVATVLMLALCLTSCDAYGFLSSLGLSDRMQAAALEGASEKYYATRGELESTYDMEYSGRYVEIKALTAVCTARSPPPTIAIFLPRTRVRYS